MEKPAQRFRTKEMASIEVYGRNGQVVANVKDLSQSGACIEWQAEDFEIRQGDLIRMTVILKSLNRRHHVNAEVVWKDGRKGGISFIPSDKVLDRLLEKSA